jgi:hypothetical protein
LRVLRRRHDPEVMPVREATRSAGRPVLWPGTVALAALLSLFLTLVIGRVLLASVDVLGTAFSELVLFGGLLLATSSTRIAAGLFAARHLRRRHGTDARGATLPSVALGTALGWAAYALLVVTASGGTGGDVDLGRLLLELPRWLVEAAAGAALVSPGEPERLDARLRRFATPRWGER